MVGRMMEPASGIRKLQGLANTGNEDSPLRDSRPLPLRDSSHILSGTGKLQEFIIKAVELEAVQVAMTLS